MSVATDDGSGGVSALATSDSAALARLACSATGEVAEPGVWLGVAGTAAFFANDGPVEGGAEEPVGCTCVDEEPCEGTGSGPLLGESSAKPASATSKVAALAPTATQIFVLSSAVFVFWAGVFCLRGSEGPGSEPVRFLKTADAAASPDGGRADSIIVAEPRRGAGLACAGAG